LIVKKIIWNLFEPLWFVLALVVIGASNLPAIAAAQGDPMPSGTIIGAFADGLAQGGCSSFWDAGNMLSSADATTRRRGQDCFRAQKAASSRPVLNYPAVGSDKLAHDEVRDQIMVGSFMNAWNACYFAHLNKKVCDEAFTGLQIPAQQVIKGCKASRYSSSLDCRLAKAIRMKSVK
jgi:hypothetical protein